MAVEVADCCDRPEAVLGVGGALAVRRQYYQGQWCDRWLAGCGRLLPVEHRLSWFGSWVGMCGLGGMRTWWGDCAWLRWGW